MSGYGRVCFRRPTSMAEVFYEKWWDRCRVEARETPQRVSIQVVIAEPAPTSFRFNSGSGKVMPLLVKINPSWGIYPRAWPIGEVGTEKPWREWDKLWLRLWGRPIKSIRNPYSDRASEASWTIESTVMNFLRSEIPERPALSPVSQLLVMLQVYTKAGTATCFATIGHPSLPRLLWPPTKSVTVLMRLNIEGNAAPNQVGTQQNVWRSI